MISVAMATYNGEKYIKRQIESVLLNLSTDDEIVISDDGSTDKTLAIVKSFNDDRIKIINGPQAGLVKNFANAIDECCGDYIFLCDQDDCWHINKVESVLQAFTENNCVLVEHNAIVCDDRENILYPSFFKHRKVRSGFIRNIMRNTYHGCLMAFKKELKKYLHPYPHHGCFHDQWIGLIAERHGGCVFLDQTLMTYYRHRGNASSFERLPIYFQIKNRINLILHIIKYALHHKEFEKVICYKLLLLFTL